MRISFARMRLELRHTFRISRSADDYRESVLVRVEEGGFEGLGEAAPSPRYGQSADSAVRSLDSFGGEIPGSVDEMDDVLAAAGERLGAETAARAALDIALHDLFGKRLDAPLWEILGLDPRRTPVTSYTIGIDRPDVIEAKIREADRFPILKIKMGLANDREIMETVRRCTGRTLRVDANEGWTKEEAIEKIHWLEGQGVELVEQPLPAARLDDCRWLAERVSMPLIADESVGTSADIPGLAGAFAGINIKLMKCGGIREALRMIHVARECGMKVMLGCMIESSIGITAAAHLSPLADYADLDGNLLIVNDPALGATVKEGKLVLPGGPGLGVKLRASAAGPDFNRPGHSSPSAR